jgi:peptidoglycan hydrolase CwlO-like protein
MHCTKRQLIQLVKAVLRFVILMFCLMRIWQSPSLVCVLQATKLQTLYAEAQSDLEEAEGKVVTLSAELEAAQDTAEKLRREMRNLQVRHMLTLGDGSWAIHHVQQPA